RVAEAMGVGEKAAERARVEPPAARREEERVLRAGGERRARVAEVPGEPDGGLLAERHDALLAALSTHPDVLLLEVDVRQVEADGFAAAQARRVDELGERAVAQCQRPFAFQRRQLAIDV